MPIYVPGKLVLRKESVPFDYDAWQYIAAVEAEDGEILEQPVRDAITNFVIGCKNDGIWDAIKACCILAGARTLNGALVPLVGTAPTNYNFVAGDYNRETGLVGDGSTKYLDSNRADNADPQNSHHLSAYSATSSSGNILGTDTSHLQPEPGLNLLGARSRSSTFNSIAGTSWSGFIGSSRSSSSSFVFRVNSVNTFFSTTSSAPGAGASFVFRRNSTGVYSSARLAFYSIGESLDLALLDARVTDLINAIGVAIP